MGDRLMPARPDLRLVPAAVVAWVAVWWATGQPAVDVARALGLAVALAAGATAGLLLHSPGSGQRTRVGPLLPAVVLIAAVLVLELAWTWPRLTQRESDPLGAWAQQRRTVTITGRVTADAAQIASRYAGAGQRWVVRIGVSSVRVGANALPSGDVRTGSASVVVIGAAPYAQLIAGQHVQITGRLSPVDAGDPALALMSPRSPAVTLDQGSWIWRAANALRAGLREACTGLPPDSGGLLPALVVGDTSRLPQTLADDLRASGLTHLTAVSGANLVIVATAVTAACAAAGFRMRARVLASALSIAGFVILARPEPSVLRAAVMAGLGLIGVLSARPGRGVPLLSATTLLLLVIDPWLSRSFGFALSVLATAGLLLLVPAWLGKAGGSAAGRPVVWRQVGAALIGVPVAALLATAPITVLLQPQLSAVSVPANLLAGPAVAFATLLGVLAAVLSGWWPWGATVAAHAGGLATGWIADVAHHGAAVPGAQIPWLPGAAGALLLAAVLLIVLVVSLRPAAHPMHPPRRPKPLVQNASRVFSARSWPAWAGWVAVPLIVLVLVLVLGGRAGLIAVPGVHRGVPDDWLVVQCDVGQGSASLINTGHGRAVMVDTGPDPALASRCLRQQRVRSLDLVAITHFHADHAGGLSGVLPRTGHPPILVSPFDRPADQAAALRAVAQRSGSPVIAGHSGLAGVIGTEAGAVRWQLLYPSVEEAARLAATSRSGASSDDDGTQINDSSLAVLVTIRGVRVLLLGDLETDAQQALFASLGQLDPVDVVVVAHHGSARQYAPLYARLTPRVALVGVGRDNDYGHPAPSALSMLRRLGVRVLRTDLDGRLTVAGTPQRLRAFGSR